MHSHDGITPHVHVVKAAEKLTTALTPKLRQRSEVTNLLRRCKVRRFFRITSQSDDEEKAVWPSAIVTTTLSLMNHELSITLRMRSLPPIDWFHSQPPIDGDTVRTTGLCQIARDVNIRTVPPAV